MNSRPESHGVRKRTANACQRCRRHKIKCSGSAPCSNCSRSGKSCDFDAAEPSVSVSRRYLANLEERLAALEERSDRTSDPEVITDPINAAGLGYPSGRAENEANASRRSDGRNVTHGLPAGSYDGPRSHFVPDPGPSHSGNEKQQPHSSQGDVEMTNPLSAGPSDTGFISDISSGRSIYLGTSSNWSFSRRVLDGAHQAVHNTPLRRESFALDGDVYNLGWDGLRVISDDDRVVLPTLNHAKYLMLSAQFHVGEMYHLFHEETFMSELVRFHENRANDAYTRTLEYVHYLLVMALGKACVSRRPGKGTPPGQDLFIQAMKILPDISQLWTDPFTTAEIFCCASLYLQGIDHRYGAYLTVGNAMRTALFQGMHIDMPLNAFSASQIERARRIWWTIYILDRELTSLMGLPVQLSDEMVTTNLPTLSSSEQSTALDLYIKLCRLNAQVVSSVYGPDGRLDKRFFTSTKLALTRIADIAEKLSKSVKLVLDDPGEGISRLAATLHLQHHQCIVLTTRPLLFSLFMRRMGSLHASPTMISSLQRLRVLLQMCTDSSQHSINILAALQRQDFLATFVPFDLEAAFSSGIIVLIASAVEPLLVENLSAELAKTYCILDDLIAKGNMIANRRKAELHQLEELLNAFNRRQLDPQLGAQSVENADLADPGASAGLHSETIGGAIAHPDHETPWMNNIPYDEWTWEAGLDAEQLMNVADLLEPDQMDAFSADFNF